MGAAVAAIGVLEELRDCCFRICFYWCCCLLFALSYLDCCAAPGRRYSFHLDMHRRSVTWPVVDFKLAATTLPRSPLGRSLSFTRL
jgi:hypothetical protein